MKKILFPFSLIALAVIFLLPILYFLDLIDRLLMHRGMLVATLVWFVTVPFWMGRKTGTEPV